METGQNPQREDYRSSALQDMDRIQRISGDSKETNISPDVHEAVVILTVAITMLLAPILVHTRHPFCFRVVPTDEVSNRLSTL